MNKKNITVISLGICGKELLTVESMNMLKNADRLFLRTEMIPCAKELREEGLSWTSLDDYYDRYDDFDEMHTAMAEYLWKEVRENGSLVYAVIDARGDGSVRELIRTAGKNEAVTVIPGISLFDLYSAACASLCGAGQVTVLAASEACETVFDTNQAYLITETDSFIRAGEIKLWMENGYDEEADIHYMTSVNGKIVCKKIKAMDADRQDQYDHTTAFFIPIIPFEKRQHYSFTDLNRLMDRLRAFDGCPWDREQTHESLKTYLLEEAWEVLGAIDDKDPDHLADELGDLLLQIAFHASIGKDFDEFTSQDVTDHICRKMIYRHSHIFGNDHCENAEEVSENWEKKKRAENGNKTVTESLRSVSNALPGLTYASKVMKKAEHYPWWKDRFDEIMNLLREQCSKEACDLLSIVAETREKSNDPEILVHNAVQKLISMLESAENCTKMDGNCLERLTNNELDVYLSRIKR